ncbi:hypothetical protein [Streptomyces sp. NPDC004546]
MGIPEAAALSGAVGAGTGVPWDAVTAGCCTGGAGAQGPGSPYGGVL